MGKAVGLQGIGLGQPARGFGQIPGLAGIDHHDGHPGGRQGRGDGHFEATGGFQDNEDRLEVPQPGHQGGNAGGIIHHAPTLCSGPQRDI